MENEKQHYLTILMERVKYINNIRMGNFKFHLLVVGVLAGLAIQKLDFSGDKLLSTTGIIIIGFVSFGVFIVGASMFLFDIWALARLIATTNGINKLLEGKSSSNTLLKKPWYGYDEDFWIVAPMMIINSAVFGLCIYSFLQYKSFSVFIFVFSTIVCLLAHIIANRTMPDKISERLGEWPDSFKPIESEKK